MSILCEKKLRRLLVALISVLPISIAYADGNVSLSASSVQSANYFFWFAGIVGVVVGYLVHKWMHKKHMASDVFLPLIPAVIVAVLVVYLPKYSGTPNDFRQACFKTITDGEGQVSRTIDLADECALSREEVTAWGIGSVISGYKSAFGYTETDHHLSTGMIYFFYFFVISFWVIVLYLLAILVNRKLKN